MKELYDIRVTVDGEGPIPLFQCLKLNEDGISREETFYLINDILIRGTAVIDVGNGEVATVLRVNS